MDKDIFVPHNAIELYDKMISEQFTGQIKAENDNLIWTLPNGIVLDVIVDNQPQEGYIGVCYLDNKKGAQLTHWHPMEDEIYGDLREINTGQVFWVKKKRAILWRHPMIMNRRVWEKYSDKKKNKYVIL